MKPPPRRLPAPPDDLQLLALTVAMESQNQSDLGKLGVAWTILNRAALGVSIADVIFAGSQFSAWMTGSRPLLSIDTMSPEVWSACYRAACGAYFNLLPDPTGGAEFYLNPILTRQLRNGTLPPWAADPNDPTHLDDSRVTLREGDHVWMRR